MRVLGIDPSSKSTGFGIIEYDETNCTALGFGAIAPSGKLPLHHKLNEIRSRIDQLLAAFSPGEVAIENPFFAHNVKTAITLGQVRGAILVAVAAAGCALYEYSPLEIKKAVTGYGQAEKGQVNAMIRALLHLQDAEMADDASDALAAAYCHLNHRLFRKKLEESGIGEQ